MAVSKVDAANQIENQLPQANIANNVNFRNYIINGDMSEAQRSTSVSTITTGGYKTIDRFNTQISSLGTWTQSQSTTVPSGQGFTSSLKMDCTVADASPAAGDYLIIDQRIEAQNLQNLSYGTSSAKQLTLSFWVRSNKTGTYNIWMYQPDDARSFSKQYTINTADTWEKKEITWAGDTTGVIDNNNGDGLRVGFYLGAGTDSTSGTLPTAWESDTQANRAVGQVNLADSTDNEWFLTGLQLEVGDTASDFEFLPPQINKTRCLRYFEKFSYIRNKYIIVGAYVFAANQIEGVLNYHEKRTNASVSFSGAHFRVYTQGRDANNRTPIAAGPSTYSTLMYFNAESGMTGGNAGRIMSSTNNDSAAISISAEL